MDNQNNIHKALQAVSEATYILIGAGAGLSEAAGIEMGGRIFNEHFSDYQKKYGIQDLYSGGFYPFPTEEERWAFWARHIWYSRYMAGATEIHQILYGLVKQKNFFVLSTNCDSQFVLSGFPEDKVFEIQGDLSEFQCSVPCHAKVYYNKKAVSEMVKATNNFLIPSELVPRCPVCGKPMSMHLRMDHTFVEDAAWHEKYTAYHNFIHESAGQKTVLLELGVGFNTPGIIRFPFEEMASKFQETTLVRINLSDGEVRFIPLNNMISVQMDLKEAIRQMGAQKMTI